MITAHRIEFVTEVASLPPVATQRAAVTERPGVDPLTSRLLGRFAPISLAEMDDVALLDRSDTKYVMNIWQFHRALAALADSYRILEIEGMRLHHYRTLYFDTVDLALYHAHHAHRRNRYKVRSRQYVDNHQAFLEIKRKAGGDRTVKRRMPTRGLVTRITPETRDFVNMHSPLTAELLEPALWNEFYRVTLVSERRRERLTLDLNVQLCNDRRAAALSDIVVAELKQYRPDRDAEFARQMRAMGLRPTPFSKYCIGVALLYPDVKHNNFTPLLRRLDELSGGNGNA